ncbi:hypothetical protein M9Y10_041806 [Tritrichomonas musculus]|uniref:Uncharacterized protein n=1 Tax=Tritrichomonas musculus TaxID=1915356 RepID=A0ABR2K5D7_9EUKA
MSSDTSSANSSILDCVKTQLQQDLNNLIENHNKEMESQKERMKIEREALTAQFQAELDVLRSKHQEEILKAEEIQKKKLESIREVLKLEANALANFSNANIDNENHADSEEKADDDNSNNNNDQINFTEDFGDSKNPIDQIIRGKFNELDEIDKEMLDLPQTSRDPQEYQKLLLINRKQYKILRDLAFNMKKKVIQNTVELNSQLIKINEAYHNQFDQFEWFAKKQAVLQDLGKLEQKSSV